jgi:hypothetical protein
MAIWADGGCLGCDRRKRRITFIAIGVIGIVIGGIVCLAKETQTGFSLMGLGGIFILCGLICPDGCCGMYRRN